MLIRLASAVVLLAAQVAFACEEDCPVEVVLKRGEAYPVCGSGELTCPAMLAMCDDDHVATAGGHPVLGLAWVAVSPGVTLCSAASAGSLGGQRRVFRVTVTR